TIKKKLGECIIFAEERLSYKIEHSIETCSFTVDLWTKFHSPYISVIIHWLTFDFELCQGLLIIKEFPYGHPGVSDNTKNMIIALQQFNYQHINCYAHTLQLVVNSGLKKCHALIDKAQTFSIALVYQDKYWKTLRCVQ
ncbi:448_t:CDS:2, partial [Funneliformis caledonium]